MKKGLLKVSLSLLGILAMAIPTGCAHKDVQNEDAELEQKEDIGPAPSFEQEARVPLSKFVSLRDEDEDIVEVNKVILHYHNDDNDCLKRRFYTWVTGIDGLERMPIQENQRWTATDMEIELD